MVMFRSAVLVVLALSLQASAVGGEPAEGTVVSEFGALGRVEVPRGKKNWDGAQSFARSFVIGRGASGAEVFDIHRVVRDGIGQVHVRLTQRIAGLPVVGAGVVVHARANSGEVLAVTGVFVDQRGDLPRHATVNAGAAIDFAAGEGGASQYNVTSAPELTYIIDESNTVRLAWTAEISYVDAEGEQLDRVYADAVTGSLITRQALIHRALSRQVYTCNNTTTLPGTLLSGNGAPDVDAMAAWDNIGYAYDYFHDVHGRDSYDDAGATIKAAVHYASAGACQASWYNSWLQMAFTDGDGTQCIGTARALDVVAHEFTHAVNDYETYFGLSGEAGSINESLSDCFAAAAEAYHDGSVNSGTWKIGEDIWTPNTSGDAMRSLSDPASEGSDRDYYPHRTLATVGEERYKNAGIQNLAFYLLSQGGQHPRGKTFINVSGIGISKAERIWYRAVTAYSWPDGKDFRAMRKAVEQAAIDLYGSNSTEWASAGNAWSAVGNVWDEYLSDIDTAGDSRYYSPVYITQTGLLTGKLSRTSGTANFDLYLEKWNSTSGVWEEVVHDTGTGSNETIAKEGTAGTYRWRVHAYANTGAFRLLLNHPI